MCHEQKCPYTQLTELLIINDHWGFPDGSVIKSPPAIQETQEIQIQPLGQEAPREGNGNPLQFACLKNSMDEEPGGLQSTGL